MASPISFSVDPRDYVDALGNVSPEIFTAPVVYNSFKPGMEAADAYPSLWPTSLISISQGLASGYQISLVNNVWLEYKLLAQHFPQMDETHPQAHLAFFESPDPILRGMIVFTTHQSGVNVLDVKYNTSDALDLSARMQLVTGLSVALGAMPDENPVLLNLLEPSYTQMMSVADEDLDADGKITPFESLVQWSLELTGALLQDLHDYPRSAMLDRDFAENLSSYLLQFRDGLDINKIAHVFGSLRIYFVDHTLSKTIEEMLQTLLGSAPNPQQTWRVLIQLLSQDSESRSIPPGLKTFVEIFSNLQSFYHRTMSAAKPLDSGMLFIPNAQQAAYVVADTPFEIPSVYPHAESAELLLRLGVAPQHLEEVSLQFERYGLSGNIFDNQSGGSLALVLDQLQQAGEIKLHDHVHSFMEKVHTHVGEILMEK